MPNSPLAPKGFVAKPFQYHEIIELEIETLTNQAHGLGRVDAWVVMVRFALPGERIKARVYKNNSNYSEADLVEVLRPSTERIKPVCPLFTRCGGCQYQHLSYSAQLSWKTRQVKELLERLAGTKVNVMPAKASPKSYAYRSKLTPHYPKPKGDFFPIGFLKEGSRHSIVDVSHCDIATEAINEALPKLRDQVSSQKEKLRFGGTLLLRDVDGRVECNPRARVEQKVGPWRFQFLAGDFFQNNPYILEDFVQYVAEQAHQGGLRYLVDAYCGGGLFAITSSQVFEQFLGIEVNAQAVASARENAKLNAVTNGSFLLGKSEELFAQVRFVASQTAVVLDPPRKGCDRAFLKQLISYAPQRIVYVSCDPATQARDLAILLASGSYHLKEVQPFDLFPQTKHIESIAVLNKIN